MQRRSVRLLLSCLLAGALVEVAVACGGSSATPQTTGTSNGTGDVARWVQLERLPKAAVPGAAVFAAAGCTACHVYAGSGHANVGAPELTAYGRLGLGEEFDIRFLRCPSCVKSGSPMPAFDTLGPKRLRRLATFLEASKGIR